MALVKSPAVTLTTFTFLLIITLFFEISYGRYGGLSIVGGLREVKNVKSNKEIQEFGRFSVEEYNRIRRRTLINDGSEELVFSEVIEAQTQVVRGINYYLKVKAIQNGILKMFQSVVWVQPIADPRPQLLKFSPSSD